MQVRHGLILIEGLTGCGKSSLAHFISRQLEANGIPHTWVHEAEMPHPLWPPEELPIEDFIEQMPWRWEAFLQENREAGKTAVVEACYFNNLVEELFIKNLPFDEVVEYGLHMQEVIRPYNPALIYLRRGPVAEALQINIADRGEGFRDFLINYLAKTAYAQANSLAGYEGVVKFWEDLIAIYEQLFGEYTIDKLLIENHGSDWPAYNRKALDFLGIPFHPERVLDQKDAEKYLGIYSLTHNEEEWQVWYDQALGCLRMNRYILLPEEDHHFLISSHHFEVDFSFTENGEVSFLIGGRDIDYLKLTGIEGVKRT